MNRKELKKYPPGRHPNTVKTTRNVGNLKPVQPGEVRNPAGRPPNGKCLTSLARELLGLPHPAHPEMSRQRYLVKCWLDKAETNVGAFGELINRLEGSVPQSISADITTDVTFIIGKGYAETKPSIPTDKSSTSGFCAN